VSAQARGHQCFFLTSFRAQKGPFSAAIFIEPLAHREWSAEKSELQLGQERQLPAVPSRMCTELLGRRLWHRHAFGASMKVAIYTS